MKQSWIFLALVLVSLTACLKPKLQDQTVYILSPADENELQGRCLEMAQQGNILALLGLIKRDTDAVLHLLERNDLEAQVSEISNLAQAISTNTGRVLQISKPEWSEAKYEHRVEWQVDRKDFRDIPGTQFASAFLIRDFAVQSVFLAGKKRDDLKSRFMLSEGNNTIRVIYTSKASALELCQLEHTLMIVLQVPYKSLGLKGNRYFNLVVRKESSP